MTIATPLNIYVQMPQRGVSLKDVPAQEFITAYAKYLKKSGNIELPKWVDIVKTGIHKELPPSNPDWFFVRIGIPRLSSPLCFISSILSTHGINQHYYYSRPRP